MERSGDAAAVTRPSVAQPTAFANALLVALAAVVIFTELGAPPGVLRVPIILGIAAPGMLVAVALLVSHTAGHLNLAHGGALIVGLVVLGRQGAPTDVDVLIVALFVFSMSMLSGVMVSATTAGILAGLFGFLMFRGLALGIGGNVGRSSDLDQSLILQIMQSEVAGLSVAVIVAVAAGIGVTVQLRLTGMGRRIRARGLSGRRAKQLDPRPSIPNLIAHMTPALLMALGTIVAISRLGTSSASSQSAFLVRPLVALIIGNAGLNRLDPAPIRVMVAYVLLEILEIEMELRGLSPGSTDVLFGAMAVAILMASESWRRRRVG